MPVPSCDDITDAMNPVFNRIMALPATSIEGLAAKAELVRFFYPTAFSDDWDDDSGTVRALVEAVELAGRSPQVGTAA